MKSSVNIFGIFSFRMLLQSSPEKNTAIEGIPPQNIISTGTMRKIMTDLGEKYTSAKFIHSQEETRSQIGKIFVWGFFVVLILSSFGSLLYNFLLYMMTQDKTLFIDLGTIIPLVGSIIGTPLGFVMGYYFKDDGSGTKLSDTSPTI